MRIKRFNESESNLPSKQDIESIFSSAFHNADEYSVVPAYIEAKSWYTGPNGSEVENIVWTVDPISALDSDNQQNAFIINLGHSFYNPSSNVYNSKPVVEDFYKYADMVADARTSLLAFKEEYPNAQIRFDMSKDSWLIIQILFKMKHLKRFNEKFNNQINKEEIINKVKFEFNDLEDAEDEVNYYVDLLTDLYNNGGEIYRLVFLDNPDDLREDDLGKHWLMDTAVLDRFQEGLLGTAKGETPYLITANIEPKQIDIEESLSSFIALPLENEINLKYNPTDYSLTTWS